MQHFRKISAILLSLLVLLSSMSFNFGMHFCMGQLESVALFSGAEQCEMANQKSASTSKKHDPECGHEITKKNCCEDQIVVIEGQDDLIQVSLVSIPGFQPVSVLYTIAAFYFESISAETASIKEYSPPLIDRDIPVLVQSFLI